MSLFSNSSLLSSSSQITIDSKSDDVYLETFLIDGTRLNQKGWKVSYDDPNDFDNRVKASLGHALVLYQKTLPNGLKIWDHPVSETGSVQQDIEYQKPYVIGKSVHNKKIREGLWHSSYKIIHEGAKRFLKSIKESSVNLFTSPYIARNVAEDRQNIRNWAIVHNAIVSDPANDKQLAKVESICEGDAQSTCSGLFASQTTPDDRDRNTASNCGYCLGDSLKDYVTSHSFKSETSSNIMSESQNTANAGAQTSTTTSNNNNNKTPNTQINSSNNGQVLEQQQQQQQQGQDQQQNDSEKTIAELKERIKQLEGDKQQGQAEQPTKQDNDVDPVTKKYESRISKLEKQLALKDRTSNVEKMLMQAIGMYTDDTT